MSFSYSPLLDLRQTEAAIRTIKEFFQTNLAMNLNLLRVSAPLFVMGGTGINDDLNGIEKPISFAVKAINHGQAEIVQSLAKWKRMVLSYGYGFNAVRNGDRGGHEVAVGLEKQF